MSLRDNMVAKIIVIVVYILLWSFFVLAEVPFSTQSVGFSIISFLIFGTLLTVILRYFLPTKKVVLKTGIILSVVLALIFEAITVLTYYLYQKLAPLIEQQAANSIAGGGMMVMFAAPKLYIPLIMLVVFLAVLFAYYKLYIEKTKELNYAKRHWAVLLFLLIVTFGLYALVWIYFTKKQLKEKGGKIPTMWLLLIPIVGYIIFGWTFCKEFKRIIEPNMSVSALFACWFFLTDISLFVFQYYMNKA